MTMALAHKGIASISSHDDTRPITFANGKARDDIRARAAYVYVTGKFPSHLRQNYKGVLRAFTATFARPASLDGRSGSIKVTSDVVKELDLENHPMVVAVRSKINKGFMIQPDRGRGRRRPYRLVFLYKRLRNGVVERITITDEGAVKEGWT